MHATSVLAQHPFDLIYALGALLQDCGMEDSEQLTRKTLADYLGGQGRTFYKEASSRLRIIIGLSVSAHIPGAVESDDTSMKIILFQGAQYS